MCFLCGTKNSFGLHAKFYECEKEDGTRVLLTVVTPKEEHQSYPGLLHGGVSAAIMDESIGRAANIPFPDIWGVTIDLALKYRKSVPYGEEIYVESRLTKNSSRGFECTGELFTRDGVVRVTATGRFIKLKSTQITPEGMLEENWFYVDENLPEEIVVG